jgi:hypothetical protein
LLLKELKLLLKGKVGFADEADLTIPVRMPRGSIHVFGLAAAAGVREPQFDPKRTISSATEDSTP